MGSLAIAASAEGQGAGLRVARCGAPGGAHQASLARCAEARAGSKRVRQRLENLLTLPCLRES